jgi:hypothetical protein
MCISFPDKRYFVIPVNHGFDGLFRALNRFAIKTGQETRRLRPGHNPIIPPAADLRAVFACLHTNTHKLYKHHIMLVNLISVFFANQTIKFFICLKKQNSFVEQLWLLP